ncbi:hypothetical conserved protein [Candidatus Nitrosoglobus terrae]|uniref:Hypothetical conserved protein n=1 Tax=Candidatus Nitrosoglobus terrae TaxID=1630141 RepID=A0A1Q2SNW0_9GAMM|nr:DUF2868 domain-containing protein [Candidatus Nitrosoglobus terrae]BAW80820.1 hypothetical conserved protein [Candidatus Nitrosoglobus terrae]
MDRTPLRSNLADLVDLSIKMDLDATVDPESLYHRDRDIGRKLSYLAGKPYCQLRYWLWQVIESDHQSFLGENAVKALRLITLVLLFLGVLVGWITALGVFAYNGTQPVNVINVLAIFVGFQLLLLLMSAVIALPQNLLHFIPGFRPLQDFLSVLSPGRLISPLIRFLPSEHRLAFEAALGRQKIHHIVYNRVRKWLILQLSQVFAVAFNLGALAGCFYLVAVSDLAFGWSTTLEYQADSFYWLMRQLAWPWRDWLEGALPSLDLIEATRFYRLHKGILPNATAVTDAAILGQWWQFLLMGIVFYGLLPRLLALTTARWRFKVALEKAFLHTPGAQQVLDRMNHAVVETGAVEPEVKRLQDLEITQFAKKNSFAGAKGYLITWAGINVEEGQLEDVIQQAVAVKISHVMPAGGKCSIEQDQRVIEELCAIREAAIIIVVKSWEPPLLDFLDFLEALRTALGLERIVMVVPVSFDDKRNLVSTDPKDLDIWRQKLQSLGDPRLAFQPLKFKAD